MKTSDGRRPSDATRSARVFWGLALAGGFASQTGCGREFYREWANQDVSEAVYEKTRDPRWRVDLFSIEPPAMSRYANPYDPDRPPAPPDDFATQELSPVPQWPDNRLLVPVEGTAYLEMMEGWQRGRSDPGNGLGILAMPRPDAPVDNTAGPATSPDPAGNPPDLPKPPEAGSTSPFNRPNTADPTAAPPIGMDPAPEVDDPAVKPKPGTNPPPLSPIQRPGAPGGNAPAPGNPPAGPTTGIPKYDLGTRMAAFRGTGLPMPAPTPDPRPDAEVRRAQNPATPPIGMDPKPGDDDLTKPGNVRPDQTPEEYAAGEKAGGELAGILVPGAIDFDEAEAAGFPQKTRPYVLAIDQSFMLALINSRVYQFQIEQLYGAALAVTLSRFAFTPQFYAGLSPITGVPSGAAAGAGFPAPTLANTFTYQTQETGTPLSSLQLGTVAGFGKAFSAGGRLLAGFANQIVFNFIGHNSIQPSVHSYLPLNLFQPFLRGAGRAVTLEPLTTSERNLVYQARIFAQFRQQFTVVTLIGGTIAQGGSTVNLAGFTAGGNTDPTIGFLNLLEDVQILENNRRNIAAFEQLVTVYTELIKGESSGLSALQLDQTRSGLQGARASLVSARTTYRNDLNNFAAQMGLPPGTPMIPDRSLTRGFKASFDGIEKWQGDPRRKLEDLPLFVEMLPKLQDTILDGRSSLGIYGIDPETNEFKANEDGLEDLLLTAERTALEHRLDLMNARGALYDAWRQIKVAANALLGYLNVTLTNSFLTPPNNNNPFGFNEQAKTFSLAIQAELPLVRVAERNNFRTALINYERTRRSLMSTEDFTKNQVRQDMRSMHLQYLTYEINKRNFVLTIRLRDQAFEQIVAPPAAAAGGNQAPLQTTNLVSFQSQLLGIENQLVTSWYQFQLARLQLYRDLGTLPIDEWEAFHAIFPDQPLTAVNLDPPAAGREAPEAPRTPPSPVSARPKRRGGKLVFAGAAAVAAAAAAAVLGGVPVPGLGKSLRLPGLIAGPSEMILTYPVRATNLPVTVVERGSLESSENKDAYCRVEGQTTIIMILAEGTKVKKGDKVCELDSSALRDQLTNQEITTRGADAAYQQSKLTREVAEIAVIEYIEGIFKQDKQTIDGEIALAQSNRERAEDRLKWSNEMLKKGYVSVGQNMSEKLALRQAEFSYEQAQTKLNVLMKYTKNKTTKELQSEVEKAKSDELAKSATLDLETTKEKKLRTLIENCLITAPGDGLIVYANDANRPGGQQAPQIEEGATVRERQKIFSIPNVTKMQVNTKVHESMIDRITPNLRAKIKVDAFAEQTLTGTVLDIQPLPDPNSFFSSDVKVYTTHVTVENGLAGLRPGMTAEVTILVTELDDVLAIPVTSVLAYKGKEHVAVKSGDQFLWRDVNLGLTNDKLVEVKGGLKDGDLVALNPISLMSEEEKREKFGTAKGDAAKKEWGLPVGKPAAAPGAPAAAGAGGVAVKGGDPAKAKMKGMGKGQRGGMGGPLSKLDAAAKAKFFTATDEEKKQILQESGMPADQIDGMLERMKNGGGGFGGGRRGPGGGGPGGPGGGGPGGGGGNDGGPGGSSQ